MFTHFKIKQHIPTHTPTQFNLTCIYLSVLARSFSHTATAALQRHFLMFLLNFFCYAALYVTLFVMAVCACVLMCVCSCHSMSSFKTSLHVAVESIKRTLYIKRLKYFVKFFFVIFVGL